MTVILGDCIEILRGLPDGCIDSLISDPPYGLSKEPDAAEVIRHWCAESLREHVTSILGPRAAELAALLFPSSEYDHGSRGFMGKSWDSFVPGPAVWREVLRVMKPGAHAVVFSGTRTYDLTVLAMRIAGFEIRDQAAWLYGTGFPKSMNVEFAIDEHLCPEHGRHYHVASSVPTGAKAKPGDHVCASTPEGDAHDGEGTALKPAQEPIVLARKPFPKGATVAANVLAHGTGGINVDACRIAGNVPTTGQGLTDGAGLTGPRSEPAVFVPNDAGRWPANVLLDEAAAAMLDEQSGTLATRGNKGPSTTETDPVSCYGKFGPSECGARYNYANASGGASRFFYVAKASRAEREAGLEHLPPYSAGELTGGRVDGSDGLNSPRAGAGRSSGNGEDVEEITAWVSEDQRAVLRVAMGRSRPRVIGGSGLSSSDAIAWNMMLFGSDTLAPSLRATTCITGTRTNSTTGSRILSYLRNSLTSANIADASRTTTASSASLVGSADVPSRSLIITVAETVSLPGVGLAASGMRLQLSSDERREKKARRCGHPTVKPIELMRYLVRLITPPGGFVLDPFAGSGTTGIAAALEGMRFVGCELDPEFVVIANARIAHWLRAASAA